MFKFVVVTFDRDRRWLMIQGKTDIPPNILTLNDIEFERVIVPKELEKEFEESDLRASLKGSFYMEVI